MEQRDLISVICIAFNHEKWIKKALDSVLLQNYRKKELIIADNGSSDETASIIKEWVRKHSNEIVVSTVYKKSTTPYCGLFNQLLSQAKGEFLVDLSGDDFLFPPHLSLSIDSLKLLPEAAFVFSNAQIQEENGMQENYYTEKEVVILKDKDFGRELYETLIRRSYISSPTLVFRSKILKEEGGYDDSLSYEDFDIQLRLTSKHPVLFSDHLGVYKRKHAGSLSSNQYQRYNSQMLPSTLLICHKIRGMNCTIAEDLALKERILFELKHALWSANFDSSQGFVNLGNDLKIQGIEFLLYRVWMRLRLDLSWLYVRLT